MIYDKYRRRETMNRLTLIDYDRHRVRAASGWQIEKHNRHQHVAAVVVSINNREPTMLLTRNQTHRCKGNENRTNYSERSPSARSKEEANGQIKEKY